ncbi:MAG: hypothetical protein FWF00_02025 [Endomicrobia bacterium]|nr:hypothetical protein [Endomicrobiia bacterium]MCL2506453.1 hypothetical protein [Endomicrobiia bacterium]
MKKLLTFVLLISVVIICACSKNDILNPPVPPAQKPDNNYDITAVAVKKADYYIRLFFDLADGYLSEDNVAKVRFGNDKKYVESLIFSNANTTGIIHSTALGSFDFWYRQNVAEGNPALTNINDYTVIGYTTNEQRRQSVIKRATGGNWKAAREMHMKFLNTDISGESFTMILTYELQGFDTQKGASISGTIYFSVIDASNSYTNNTFTVNFYDLRGKIKMAHEGEDYFAGPKFNFIIEGGDMIVQGTGALAPYKVSLSYSNDEGVGQFTVSGAPYATYVINKSDAYYIKTGDSAAQRRYLSWDYPI